MQFCLVHGTISGRNPFLVDLAHSAFTVHGLEFPSCTPYPGFDYIQDTVLHVHRKIQIPVNTIIWLYIITGAHNYYFLQHKLHTDYNKF